VITRQRQGQHHHVMVATAVANIGVVVDVIVCEFGISSFFRVVIPWSAGGHINIPYIATRPVVFYWLISNSPL